MKHSPELAILDKNLSALFERVQRRQRVQPALPEDGILNNALLEGLRHTVDVTHQFMRVRNSGAWAWTQAQSLNALAHQTYEIAEMVRTLEGAKHLSPLFDRMMNREYFEFIELNRQIRDIVTQDAAELNAAPEKQEPPPLPVLAYTALMLPSVMALMVMSSWSQGWIDAAERHKAVARRAQLKLVHSA